MPRSQPTRHFFNDSIPGPLLEAFADPTRLCPMLAGPALLAGSGLTVRTAQDEVEVNAPRALLKKVFQACDGTRSIQDIVQAQRTPAAQAQIQRFMAFLLDNGALIDANLYTAQALRYGHQVNPFGLAAPSALSNQICRRFTQDIRRDIQRDLLADVADEGAQAPGSSKKRSSAKPLPPALANDTLEPIRHTPLSEVFEERISTYTYGDQPVKKKQLLDLLWSLAGVVRTQHERAGLIFPRRTLASAGGLYLVQVYVFLKKSVGRYTPGVYRVHYPTEKTVLLHLVSDRVDLLPRAFAKPWELTYATGAIFLMGDVATASLRYRNRALQYLFMEAGAILHNGALVAPQLDLGYVPIGGYYESMIESLCHEPTQPANRVVLGSAVFGAKPTQEQVDTTLKMPVFEFAWADAPSALYSMPFYLGRARIRYMQGEEEFSPHTWGRSSDPWLACRKALAEAIEREGFREPKNIIFGRLNDIEGAVDPRLFVRYTPQQYGKKSFPYLPFDEKRSYAWTKAHDYTTGKAAHVLANLVFTRNSLTEFFHQQPKFGLDMAGIDPYTQVNSSGCAAGVSLDDAFERAVLELVERDAFMRCWLTQQSGQVIALQSLPAWLKKRIQALQETGCLVTVQALQTPWSNVCLVAAQHEKLHFTTMGTAAHDDFESALLGALDELEARVFVWLNAHIPEVSSPQAVSAPEHHFELYGNKAYFQRADSVLFPTQYEVTTFKQCAKKSARHALPLMMRFVQAGLAPLCVDITPQLCYIDQGRTQLFVTKALIPTLIPMSFGYQREPRGMLTATHRASMFPHPFP